MQKFEHGGNVYQQAPDGKSWLDFSANINPLGLPASVKQAMQASLDDVIHYPDPQAKELKQAIAEHYQLPEQNLILGNGAAELFYLFMQMLRPKHVLLPVPSFSEYERAARAAGCRISYFPLKAEETFYLDWQKLSKAVTPSVDCVILGNPNNPTGQLLPWQELSNFFTMLKLWQKNVWVLVDESFLDFLPDDSAYTWRYMTETFPYLFVIQSLTKFYAIPGLRLGFGVANAALIQRLEQGKDVWNVNLLAQKAGVAALSDAPYQEKSRELVQRERAWLYAALRKIEGIYAYPPSVNFILLNIEGTGKSSAELTKEMRERGILVRDCGNYPGLDGRNFIRVAVRTREENLQLIQALEECVKYD